MHHIKVHVDCVGTRERVGDARRRGGVGRVPVRGAERIERMGEAALGDVDGDVGEAGERVVPAVALEAGVALEEAAGDPRPLGGAPERLRVLGLGVEGHHQRIGADRGEARCVAPVVDVG